MIDIEEFLCGLQCTWIKKCINSTINNWRYDINIDTNYTPINFFQFSPIAVELQLHSNISLAWETFKVCFYHLNDNFLQSNLYGNPLLINNSCDKLRMDLSQLPVPVTGNWDVRKSLKICDFLSDTGEPKSQQDF
jgi:hypothetical protein